MRQFHGNRVGGKRRDLYVCDSCRVWNEPLPGKVRKPAQCSACGHMNFIYFPSRAEATRFGELLLQQSAGMVRDVRLQPKFPLMAVNTTTGKTTKLGEYRGDFAYDELDPNKKWVPIVEDVKGNADTTMSAWKRKHVAAQYGVNIRIVKR